MDSYSCRGKKVSEIGSLSEKESFCYRVLHRTVKGLSLRLSCFCSCVLFCFCGVVFFWPVNLLWSYRPDNPDRDK